MKIYTLFALQYLGFGYHGWSKQPGIKTIQGTLEQAFAAVLLQQDFQLLGASRTDSMVSAQETYCELITEQELIDKDTLIKKLNDELPPDIRILWAKTVTRDFKIISSAKCKEYHYYFSYGEKLHPFCAPFMAMIKENLDIELMKKAASLFEGEHDFSSFCYRLRDTQSAIRTIESTSLEINRELSASFFPEKTYVFKVKAASFLRHQVRAMMGALFMVGMKTLTLEELERILKGKTKHKIMTAPASGLSLQRIHFHDS